MGWWNLTPPMRLLIKSFSLWQPVFPYPLYLTFSISSSAHAPFIVGRSYLSYCLSLLLPSRCVSSLLCFVGPPPHLLSPPSPIFCRISFSLFAFTPPPPFAVARLPRFLSLLWRPTCGTSPHPARWLCYLPPRAKWAPRERRMAAHRNVNLYSGIAVRGTQNQLDQSLKSLIRLVRFRANCIASVSSNVLLFCIWRRATLYSNEKVCPSGSMDNSG